MNEQKLVSTLSSPGLMAAKEVTKTANISRAHLHSLVQRRQFPQPALRIGTRYTRWKACDVHAWLADPQSWIALNASKAGAEVSA